MKKRILVVLPLSLLPCAVFAEDDKKPLQGIIEHKQAISVPVEPVPDYPKPVFVPVHNGAARKGEPKKEKQKTLKGKVSGQQSAVKGYLAPQFLGVWQVSGTRSAIEAQPQYRSGVSNIFAATTSNTWRIEGNQSQGYLLSTNTGVQTRLTVETHGDNAILRYQHPINQTLAQEALVMQLLPGGAQFDGLESISIVKPNEPPRAKVTYKLIGRRQN